MDLTTSYLGMTLKNPIVPSASPFSKDIVQIKRMEEAGAAAVVLHSLFEEQIAHDEREMFYHLHHGSESSPEAQSYFVDMDRYNRGPEWYLEHIHRAKAAVGIPIIASLNGSSHSGWLDYAKKIEQAGADALELNMYYIAADIAESATSIEHRYLEIARTLRQSLRIPIAIKLSPFFTSFAHFAKHMDDCGINGLVLFNRFYQPDINLETLEVMPNVILSQSSELRLALRWIAILHGRVRADLAATGGIHTHEDVIKALLAGASITMVCSTLLKNGIARITDIVKGMETWLIEREYESVKQLQGSMSQKSVSDPTAFERANYMRALSGYNLPNDLLYHN